MFRCPSGTHRDVIYTVVVAVTDDYTLSVTCNCPAGFFARHDVGRIPCRHAKAVGDYLEEEGIVERYDDRYTVVVGDPMAELAAPPLDPDPPGADSGDVWMVGYQAGWSDAVAALANGQKGGRR